MQKEFSLKNLLKNVSSVVFVLFIVLAFAGCDLAGVDGIDGTNGTDGTDGNANVTLYLFDGNDFSINSSITLSVENVTETDHNNSAWLIYLTTESGLDYSIPGNTSVGGYGVNFSWSSIYGKEYIYIKLAGGMPEDFPQIKVIQIVANDVVDNQVPRSVMTAVDVTNCQAILDYYGLTEK